MAINAEKGNIDRVFGRWCAGNFLCDPENERRREERSKVDFKLFC